MADERRRRRRLGTEVEVLEESVSDSVSPGIIVNSGTIVNEDSTSGSRVCWVGTFLCAGMTVCLKLSEFSVSLIIG